MLDDFFDAMKKFIQVLTTDRRTIGEGLSDFRIKIYHNFSIYRELLISKLDLLPDPVFESIADERINEVNQPLFWYLSDLANFR